MMREGVLNDPWSKRLRFGQASNSPTALLFFKHRYFMWCLPGDYFSKEAQGHALANPLI
jgi:hypothetical protein